MDDAKPEKVKVRMTIKCNFKSFSVYIKKKKVYFLFIDNSEKEVTKGNHLNGKIILITGGTGSFGRAFARKVLTEYEPQKVIIFSRDEWKQWEMLKSEPIFAHPKIRYFLGDIRDKDRLMRAFDGVDYIVHAAALKQVPKAEYNPSEFVQTNVIGAMNIIDVCIERRVQKVVALSTDKAVNPINLYGATKLCSDKIFVAGNAYVGMKPYPQFANVRWGNVIGSRGSIIPLWKKMVKDGVKEIPVTDPRMTRFWITLEQSVDFVIKCFAHMSGGEIFVPKIPSMRLVDLAEAIAPRIKHQIIGIREGEKLHELLIGLDDARHTLEFQDHYVIVPEVYNLDRLRPGDMYVKGEGKRLVEGFEYASDNNSHWIGVDELRRLLHDQESRGCLAAH